MMSTLKQSVSEVGNCLNTFNCDLADLLTLYWLLNARKQLQIIRECFNLVTTRFAKFSLRLRQKCFCVVENFSSVTKVNVFFTFLFSFVLTYL